MTRGLTDAERHELATLRVLNGSVEHLKPFVDRVDKRYPSPAHVKPIREVFERARIRATQTLIMAPPRSVKTHTIKCGLTHSATYDPAAENAFISATATLATDKSQEIRRIAQDAGVPVTGRRENWRTPQGGRLISLGIGSQYNGTGTTGIQVFDDPYPTTSHALSANYRKKVVTYKEGTCDNRCEDDASQLILHTRFHPQDLIGHLLDKEPHRWNVIRLQAVIGYDEGAADRELRKERGRQALKRQYRAQLLGRGVPVPEQLQPDYPSWQGLVESGIPVGDGLRPELESIGKALWPEYWPISRLLPLMRHKRWWAAIYQQDPQPDGARVFFEPARFTLADIRSGGGFRLEAARLGIGADPAATESQSADHSAAVLMAMRGFGNSTQAWVLDVHHEQQSTTAFSQQLVRWQRKYRCPVFVEAVGGFRAIPQTMRLVAQLGPQIWRCPVHGVIAEPLAPRAASSETGIVTAPTCSTCGGRLEIDTGKMRVEEAPALGSKLLRAQPMAVAWNDGRVLVPIDASWADGYIQEHLDFTGMDGEPDDLVDASAHDFNALYRESPAFKRGPRELLSMPFG